MSPIGVVEPIIDADVTVKMRRDAERWIADVDVRNANIDIPSRRNQALFPPGAPPDMVFESGHRMEVALRLHERHEIALHDAVLVTRRQDGELDIDEPVDSTVVAATVPAALVGAVTGAVIAGPLGFLLGMLVAGGAGVAIAKWIGAGISDRILAELARAARPAQTILALETGPADKRWHGRCSRTSMEDSDEDHTC